MLNCDVSCVLYIKKEYGSPVDYQELKGCCWLFNDVTFIMSNLQKPVHC